MIADFIPAQSLVLVVGDSGLGKSPLCYQQLLCVAAGVPFLGRPTERGRVLYMDFENGTAQVAEIAKQLARHLGLFAVPSDLLFWNFNDAPDRYGQPGCTWQDIIRAAKPKLAVIDPISAVFPDIEKGNPEAAAAYAELRPLMQELGCSLVGVHHTRKPKAGSPVEHLDEGNARDWFNTARGPRLMINGADVRLGVDKPSKHPNAAVVVRGFRRVHGEIPLIHLARTYDDDGEPLGYYQIEGEQLISETDLEVLRKLPANFRFKDAQPLFNGDSRKASEFLQAVVAAGVLQKLGGWKGYTKLMPAPPVPTSAGAAGRAN